MWLLQHQDCHIVRLDVQGAAFPLGTGKAHLEDHEGDVRAPDLWSAALPGVDVVFHLAGQTSAYVANQDPQLDLEINVRPMLNLLETCRRDRLTPTLVFAGTATEVGMTSQVPVNETLPDNPVTLYDLHKLMSEHYLRCYVDNGIVSGATLRLANVYGAGPRSGSADRGVLNAMIRKALRGETLTIYGRGEWIRDYVHAEDVARAFLDAAACPLDLKGRHFLIGSGQGHSLAEAITLVAERVGRKTGQEVSVTHVPPPEGLSPIEARNFVADTTAFFLTTGWKARISLLEGIDSTIDYYMAKEQ
jgi:nucleoside-diphosphate-sugar epimerase